MITYFYWGSAMALAIALLVALGRADQWKAAFGCAIVVLFGAWLAYFFHFQQVFVKQYGGVMSIKVPAGQVHLGATWKDDNLWIENYDPANNVCHFNEYSKGNLLQGKVTIKNCNPMLPVVRQPDVPSLTSHAK